MQSKNKNTSWNAVSSWYSKLVGTQGHYYHEHVVLPNVIRLLALTPKDSLLDLGCGQGILAHVIPSISTYKGMDIAKNLIQIASSNIKKPGYSFQVCDVTKSLMQAAPTYTHATMILSLQNMKYPETAIQNASNFLMSGGKLVMVINHPCFRIPRQSGWGIDEKTKQQYRWENRYKTSMEIPVSMHPGDKNSPITWSFHHSLHDYSQMLSKSGFFIESIDEWTSDKESEGKAARMENRARSEFPLFLCIVAIKK